MSNSIISEINQARLNRYIETTNSELENFMKIEMDSCGMQREIAEAMSYTLFAGGKRVRAMLVMEFCRLCGGEAKAAVSAACAIEMIHAFSLIHDDLPCMDDDDFRRGKPSCHKVYGEAIALLAGDALENKAFEIIAKDHNLSNEVKVKLITVLSKAIGVCGMIGGQVIDTVCQEKMTDKDSLFDMYRMKTGALIRASCEMGCIVAEAYDKVQIAGEYGEKLGIAFQIIDDILDVKGNEKTLGKPVGSDEQNEKNTSAVLCGIDEAERIAQKLTDDAMECLSLFEDHCFLSEISEYLLKRKK